MYLTVAVIVLVFVIIFQIAKASEYVAILKGEEDNRKQTNKINGFLMISFLILGLIGIYFCNEALKGKVLGESASVQGDEYDWMFNITLLITGIVFFITQILLFWFVYKYQEKEGKKVHFFVHSTKLELIWTSIPAIVLTILVVFGLKNWYKLTADAPKEAMVVEVTGKQFGWIFRYPGKDNEFGKKYFRNIDPANNSLGMIWEDKKGQDDIVIEQTLYIIKDKPVKLIIGSRDVIHDVGLPHFRMKMDAVPGTPTTMWFTPKYTTKEMKEKTGNPNFVYELACDQMCGNGHYSMKGIIEVVTQEEYNAWISEQQPYYNQSGSAKTNANVESLKNVQVSIKPKKEISKG